MVCIRFHWNHNWVPNGLKDGTEYTCLLCNGRKVGKPYEVRAMTLREENGVLVGEMRLSDDRSAG